MLHDYLKKHNVYVKFYLTTFFFKKFLCILYSPVRDNILVNDRWGNETRCKHGDIKDCADKFDPGIENILKFYQIFFCVCV